MKGLETRLMFYTGLYSQCSATEPRQPDNHQPSQSSICSYCRSCTELASNPGSPFRILPESLGSRLVLNASTANLAATQHVPSELQILSLVIFTSKLLSYKATLN